MAIKLSANYSKKLGLPQYSSHSFSVSVEVELTDISQAEEEIQNLYQLLQQSVDQEIKHSGFVPSANGNGNGHAGGNGNTWIYEINGNGSNGNGAYQRNGSNGQQQPSSNGQGWNCTEGQKGFILRLISDNKLDKQDVEEMAMQLFNGSGVRQLNKMQASQLIEEMLAKSGKPRQNRWQRQPQRLNP